MALLEISYHQRNHPASLLTGVIGLGRWILIYFRARRIQGELKVCITYLVLPLGDSTLSYELHLVKGSRYYVADMHTLLICVLKSKVSCGCDSA